MSPVMHCTNVMSIVVRPHRRSEVCCRSGSYKVLESLEGPLPLLCQGVSMSCAAKSWV